MAVGHDAQLDEVMEAVKAGAQQGAEFVVHERHLAEFPQTQNGRHQHNDTEENAFGNGGAGDTWYDYDKDEDDTHYGDPTSKERETEEPKVVEESYYESEPTPVSQDAAEADNSHSDDSYGASNDSYEAPEQTAANESGGAANEANDSRPENSQNDLADAFNSGNEGSKRIVLKCGGAYESDVYDSVDGVYVERYWIDLSE